MPSMAAITLTVNGRAQTVDVDPATPLLYVLRNDLDLQGPRFGCGLGQCGACSVIINGAAVRSCVTPVSAVKGDITTLEGLAEEGSLHPVQQAWIDEQVPQCGFCQNGQIMTAKVLLDRNPNPTDQQIREGMAGALCRCMTYYRVQAAVKRAAATMRAEGMTPRSQTFHDATFLKGSGLLVVGVGAAVVGRTIRLADSGRERSGGVGRIPTSISASSIRGSSSTRTTPRRSTSARRISARGPARHSAR